MMEQYMRIEIVILLTSDHDLYNYNKNILVYKFAWSELTLKVWGF